MLRYEGNISYIDDLRADFTAGVLFGALKFRLFYGTELEGGLYFLGFRIKTLEQIADENEAHGKEESLDNEKSTDKDESEPEAMTQYKAEAYGTAQVDFAREIESDLDTLKRLLKKAVSKARETRIVLMDLFKMSDRKMRQTILQVFKNVLKQIMPRKISGDFKFGLDDPYYTGKILEIFTLLYAKMGEDLKVEPVWDNTCYKGELRFEGRIHLSILLWNLLKLVFNSQFRQIWREYNGK